MPPRNFPILSAAIQGNGMFLFMGKHLQPLRGAALSVVAFLSVASLLQPTLADETKPEQPTGLESPQVEAIDIPTAEILDPKTYSTAFRFYNSGGVTSRLVIGPLKRANLGLSFDVQNLIGSGNTHAVVPEVYFKLRAFDGTDILPALALGYDHQGYLYQLSTKSYLQEGKGFYLVGSHEIFIPNLELHAGVNVNDLNNGGELFGFFGATCKLVDSFALLAEYDNIRNGPEDRVNLGGRYWVASYFNVDFAARNVGRGTERGAERIVRLNYVGNLPF
jgi:hypothetical protein